MPLVPWRPLSEELESFRREINRVFEDFFGRGLETGIRPAEAWTPCVDVAETEDSFIVTAEVPGMSKDDIKISLSGNVLTLRGEKKEEKEERERNYHRVERRFGSFSRSFTLPTDVDASKVKASYKDGVLRITLPKKEEVKPKEIAVTVE